MDAAEIARLPVAPARQFTAREFTIEIPREEAAAWHASNGEIGVTLVPSAGVEPTSKNLADGRAVHLFKANYLRKACTPRAYREQWLVGELGGLFVHVGYKEGRPHVVIADRRMDP